MADREDEGSGQKVLFEIDQRKNGDGSFTITPKRVADGRKIDVQETMRRLKFKCPKRVRALLELGELEGYKNASKNGNGKIWIYEDSVTAYEARRRVA